MKRLILFLILTLTASTVLGDVVLYSRVGCLPCAKQKALLDSAGIPHRVVYVTAGVTPTLVINGQVVVGLTPLERIRALLTPPVRVVVTPAIPPLPTVSPAAVTPKYYPARRYWRRW